MRSRIEIPIIKYKSTFTGSVPAYVVAPSATSGNYFETLHDRSRRVQALSNFLVPSRRWHGTHQLSTGVNVSGIDFTQSALRNEIDVVRANNTLLQRTTFFGPSAFQFSTTQVGLYAQDAWQMARPLLLHVGVREDWDRLVQNSFFSPRVACQSAALARQPYQAEPRLGRLRTAG